MTSVYMLIAIATGVAAAALFALLSKTRWRQISAKKSSPALQLIEKIDSGVIITDAENDNILFINEKMKSDFVIGESGTGAKKCYELFTNGAQVERCHFCPKNELAPDSGETKTREFCSHVNGKWYRVTGKYIDWSNGSRVFMEQCDDITELKFAIAQTQEMEERVQLMLNAAPVCCTMWDEHFYIVNCNQVALTFFGLQSAEELNQKFVALSPEFQPCGTNSITLYRTWLSCVLESGATQVEEWMHQTLTGEPLPCEITFARLEHRNELLVVCYTRDLREHKAYIEEIERARENMRIARDTAEAASLAKTTFLANMSHEIRTPMNSIIGFSELAADDDIPQKTRDYLNKISENANWLLLIINDILDISKIESGKMELEFIPFDLHDIFTHCHTAILPKAAKKGLSLYCYAESSTDKKILGDPIRLRQVLINILSNAVKFTNVGTIKLFASIVRETEKSVTIHFEIKDSGIGMSKDEIAKIFEPFTQADSSVTRKYGGTGLGLTITRNIIELMGSKLFVESAVGIGSKFYFELTFDTIEPSKDLSPREIEFQDLEKPHFTGEVLICEDNLMNQQVICEHLKRVGLNSVIAENGEIGVNLVKERMLSGEKPFDLIFMDIHMPVMDGLEAASKIIELGVKTPIIAMTANVMTNDLELYRKSGMSEFLGKPFTSQELWKCLMRYFKLAGVSTIDKTQMNDEDEKMQKHLMLNFVKCSQTICMDIANAIRRSDIKLAHRLAHTLKGNAGQIGEKHLQLTAEKVEKALSNGENHLTVELLKELETELSIVLKKLTPLLKSAAAAAKKSAGLSASETEELFAQLETMLARNNPECMNLLDDLRAVPNTEELVQYIEDFEFKHASAELFKVRGKRGQS